MSEKESKSPDPLDETERVAGLVRSREVERSTSAPSPNSGSSKRARLCDTAVLPAPTVNEDMGCGVLTYECCAICLEGESEGKDLMDHCCPRCTVGAWRVCEPCNDAILSRRCPVCHGDYKAIEFYAFLNPDDGDSDLAGLAVAAFSRCKVSVIASSNVMIWLPSCNKLSFSLPIDASVPKRDIQYLSSAITPTADDIQQLRAGVFSFSNRVWDSLEAAEESTEQFGVREMLAWVLNSLSNTDSVLFTALTKDQQMELLRETLMGSLPAS